MAIRVMVASHDCVLELGVTAQLRGRAEVQLVDALEIDSAAVAIVAIHELTDDAVRLIRAVQRDGCPRVVVVSAQFDEATVLEAVEAGACALVRTADATPGRLVEAVIAAASGAGSLPPDLLGPLLAQVGRLQRGGAQHPARATMLSDRELDVLKLVAEGLDTTEIAHTLCYSERTIKGIIHGVTSRLRLRNRTHAVAFAVREGLI